MSICVLAYQLATDRRASIREAAHMALPTRIELKDDARQSVHEIIDELLEKHCSENPGIGSGSPFSAISFTEPTTSRTLAAEASGGDDAINLLENLGDVVDLKKAPPDELGWSIAQHYADIKRRLKDKRLLQIAVSYTHLTLPTNREV